MKKTGLLIVLMMAVACGRWEGHWMGECENPGTGESREFDIDIDEDKGGEVTGTAFMTITDSFGDEDIVSCAVTGDSNRKGVDMDFECDNGESFTIATTKTSGDLLGYCDSDKEVELWLTLD